MKKVLTLCAVAAILGCGGIEDAGQPLVDDMEDEVASFLIPISWPLKPATLPSSRPCTLTTAASSGLRTARSDIARLTISWRA